MKQSHLWDYLFIDLNSLFSSAPSRLCVIKIPIPSSSVKLRGKLFLFLLFLKIIQLAEDWIFFFQFQVD